MEGKCISPQEERTVYLVRHAESRYNAAVKNLNLFGIMRETDHGISLTGVDQCCTLATAIRNANESKDVDAIDICNRVNTLSSPLCRTIKTAILALPSVDGPITLVSDGREPIHKGSSLFMRDSIGSYRSKIKSKVNQELSIIQCDQNLPELDLSRLEEVWWTVGEPDSSLKERIKRLLLQLYETAAQPSATVFIGHSRIIRFLFQECASEKFSETKLCMHLQEKFVQNCALLRVKLKPLQETKITIVDAEFLFGTGF